MLAANGGKCASLSVSFFLSVFFLPSFLFFHSLSFYFLFLIIKMGHIYCSLCFLMFQLLKKSLSTSIFLAQDVPDPPHADPALDLGPTCLPKMLQSSVREQDLEPRIWLSVCSLYCQKVTHFIVQNDLTPESGWGFDSSHRQLWPSRD